MVTAWGSTLHLQACFQFGFIAAGEPPQIHQELRTALTEIWVTKVMLQPMIHHRGCRHTINVTPTNTSTIAATTTTTTSTTTPRRRPTLNLPESVQVQLTDEAAEVGRLKEISSARGVLRAGQEVRLEQVLVDDEPLAAGVPADGSAHRVVR